MYVYIYNIIMYYVHVCILYIYIRRKQKVKVLGTCPSEVDPVLAVGWFLYPFFRQQLWPASARNCSPYISEKSSTTGTPSTFAP